MENRGAWVFDPDTYKLVPREQYERRVARAVEAERLRSDLPSPQVMRDIEPFVDVAVGGGVIGSRSQKRELMKRHNLVEIGTEKRVTRRQLKKSSVKQSLQRARQELSMT